MLFLWTLRKLRPRAMRLPTQGHMASVTSSPCLLTSKLTAVSFMSKCISEFWQRGESCFAEKESIKTHSTCWSIWDQTSCISMRCGLWWGSGGTLQHSAGAGHSHGCRLKLTSWGCLREYACTSFIEIMFCLGKGKKYWKTNLEEVGDRFRAACFHHGASEQI